MKYLVVVEPTPTGFSSYSPDLPGCVATGSTQEEVKQNMKEAVSFHIEGLKLEGFAIPQPASIPAYVDVAA